MAKKVKTPEELQAKLDKKTWKRKVFFGTFTKTLAFFLAIAMVFTLATIAFQKPVTTTTSGGSSTVEPSTDDMIDLGGGSGEGQGGSGEGGSNEGGSNEGGSGESQSGTEALSKADIIKAVNEATAKAADAGYDWKRDCKYTPDGAIDVGSATSTLNGIIQGVDPNADLGSVVGNFIGIGSLEAKKAKGAKEVEGMKADYMLKAMSLTEGDCKQAVKNGDVYMIQVNASENPQKDNSHSLYKATSDFITHDEVNEGIKAGLGSAGAALLKLNTSNVVYSQILIKATIVEDSLTNLELSYTFEAELGLKATFVPINGTGKATMTEVYSNFVY